MWLSTDPREQGGHGRIVVYTGTEAHLAFYDTEYEDNYYIMILNHPYSRYKHIGPGEEVEEWPQGWSWCRIPEV